MTDKQIIYGVDVSGCCFYNNGKCDNPNGMACNCINNAVCYFKELKHKEQECEELKEDRERWKSNFNGKVSAIEELLKQLDQLKTKNDELKKILNEGCLHNLTLMTEQRVLLQTFTEIKEIAEKQVKRAPDGETFARPEIKQILQKISECEVEYAK